MLSWCLSHQLDRRLYEDQDYDCFIFIHSMWQIATQYSYDEKLIDNHTLDWGKLGL